MTSIIVSGKSNVGLVRSTNEDSYVALGGEESPPGVDALLVVADGMGGHAAGEVASRMAVEGVIQDLNGRKESAPPGRDYAKFLGTVLEEVNREVHNAAQGSGMGTTCTIAAIVGDRLHIAHVGDSRAY